MKFSCGYIENGGSCKTCKIYKEYIVDEGKTSPCPFVEYGEYAEEWKARMVEIKANRKARGTEI